MISYQTDGIEMPAIKKSETTEWIKAVAATYNKRIGEIAYIFCSDEKILEVNRQYLQHDYYTDIITFDYCEGNRLSPATSSSAWIRYAPTPNSLPAMTTNGSCTASSSTASCTFAALTTKDRENGKSWKPPKTRRSPCDKIKRRIGKQSSTLPPIVFLHNLSSLVTNHLASLYQRGIADVTTNMIRVMTNNRSSPSKTGYALWVNALTQ